ncbi:MAG: hypothetical protein JWP91_1685 [Fibrobacteres bacterium]|nr:hypothetical protein [Fibrobacterota bacterium]
MTKPPLGIAIVTPSYNQAEFLEETILSVLGQNYPRLEYAVIDGGSTDGSREIIEKYADRLVHWVSEKDKGTYDAVNKGFAHTKGEIMAWINSDDKFPPWTFALVAELFTRFPQIEWMTSAYPMHWDKGGLATNISFVGGFNGKSFLLGANLPAGKFHVGSWIQQESTFWRRSLWEKAGGAVDIKSISGDFDLWAKFFQHAELYSVTAPLGGFRRHGEQISVKRLSEYVAHGEQRLKEYGGGRAGLPRRLIRFALHKAFGGRPLHRVPGFLTAPMAAMGLLFPVPLVSWDHPGGWKIVRNYVF